MKPTWPSSVTKTIEIGSQRGPAFDGEISSFSDVINTFLKLGWCILSTYVEGKGTDSTREECLVLLGWDLETDPKYPSGYGD